MIFLLGISEIGKRILTRNLMTKTTYTRCLMSRFHNPRNVRTARNGNEKNLKLTRDVNANALRLLLIKITKVMVLKKLSLVHLVGGGTLLLLLPAFCGLGLGNDASISSRCWIIIHIDLFKLKYLFRHLDTVYHLFSLQFRAELMSVSVVGAPFSKIEIEDDYTLTLPVI